MRDLAGVPECAATKQRLWSRSKQQLIQQDDPRMLGEGDIFDSYPFFGRIQPAIAGFKSIGRYNPAFWPASRGPLP